MNKTKISLIMTISFLVVASSSSSIFGYGGPPEQSSSGNYSVEVIFDKESYSLGESIIISGNVNKFNEERTLKITIFDSNQNLVLNQKISVNSDTSFSQEIIPGEKFLEGEYIVRAQYGTSKVTIEKTSFIINSNDEISSEQKPVESTTIPDWVRSNAAWWAEGSIDDNSFVQGIQFMIKEGLMRISQ